MISSALAKTGLWLLQKSANIGFTAQMSEQLRKFFAIHPQIASQVGYTGPTYSGKNVDEFTALNCSAVWRCVQVISQAESWLPLHVMQEEASGARVVAQKHPLDWVLSRKPNTYMTSIRMRQMLMAHVLMWGNAYARIVHRGGTGQTIGLWPIAPNLVTPKRRKDGSIYYEVARIEQEPEEVEWVDMFHLAGLGFDGLRGYSVVSMARQTIGLAQVQEEYASKFFANGGRRPYYLRKLTPFKTDFARDEWQERWQQNYASTDGFHKAPLIIGDMELHELGMPLEDAELLASRQFSVSDICRWFGVQPHLAFDLTRSTNNNIEHQGLEFVQQTLMYWLRLFEEEAESQLLTAGEQGWYYVKHNVNALQRADFETRMKGYATGLQNGYLNPDIVCALEELPTPANGAGKAYHIQSNMQTLPAEGLPLPSDAAMKKPQEKPKEVGDGNQAD